MRQGQAKRAASYSAKYFAILGDAPLTPWIMQVALQARDGGFADAVGAIDHGQILMIGRGMRVSPRYLCVSQGLKELSAHRTDEALHWFRQAVSHRTLTWGIDPFDDILANTLLDVGRVDEAIAEYQRVLVRAPALIRTHYQLGTAYARKHELASSRREYERFLALWHDADRDAPEIVSARAWLDARQPNVSTE
jgi:tetratricopeptide (TPR) repeat protein